MAIDEGFSVAPPTAVPSSGLDLAKIASGRVVEARVASLAEGLAIVTTRHGSMQVDAAVFGDKLPAVGDTVRLQVQPVEGGGRPTVTVVEGSATPPADAAPATPRGEQAALVLAEAVRSAAANQTGLASLYATLAGLAAAPPESVPEPVRAVVAQLMGARLADGGAPSADAVKRAFLGSGLFLESRLAGTPGSAARPGEDLKAALFTLRAALGRWVGGPTTAASSLSGLAPSAQATRTTLPPPLAARGGATGGAEPATSGRGAPAAVGGTTVDPSRGPVGRLIGAYGAPGQGALGQGTPSGRPAVAPAPTSGTTGAVMPGPVASAAVGGQGGAVPVGPRGGTAATTVPGGTAPAATAAGAAPPASAGANVPVPPATTSAAPTVGGASGAPSTAPTVGSLPGTPPTGAIVGDRPGAAPVAPTPAGASSQSPASPSIVVPGVSARVAPAVPPATGPSPTPPVAAAPPSSISPPLTGVTPVPTGPAGPTGTAGAVVPGGAGMAPPSLATPAGGALVPPPAMPNATLLGDPVPTVAPMVVGEAAGSEAPSVDPALLRAAAAMPVPQPGLPIGAGDDAVVALLRTVVRGLEIAGSLTPLRADEASEAAAALAAIGTERDGRPPPPRRGQAPRGQPALPADRIGTDGVEGLGRRALEHTEGALSRILLEQFAALDRRGDDPVTAPEARGTREWAVEMPIATRDGTAVVQMTVERDGGRDRTARAGDRGWRVRFSMDVEPLGPIHAQIGLVGEKLSIGLWAERPDAASRLGDDVGRLQGALEAAAIPVESIHLATGRPASGGPAPTAGRFVDVKL